MDFNRKWRYALSICSGLLMVLSFPFTGSLTLLIFVAWIPLLLIEGIISEQKLKSRNLLIHTLITFLLFNVGTSWWIWNASPEGSIMAIVVNTFMMSAVFYLFHLTKKYVGSKQGYLGLLFYWMAFEYMHFHWEIAWPWLTLGNYFSIFPSWVQWYSYSGAQGGTLWILVINLLIYRAVFNMLIRKESRRIQTPLFWLAGLGFAIPMTISLISYYSYDEKIDPVEIVIVQNNVDPYNGKFGVSSYDHVDNMMALARTKLSSTTDLVLMPETSLGDHTIFENDLSRDRLLEYIKYKKHEQDIKFLYLGSFSQRNFDEKRSFATRGEPGHYFEVYNSSVFLDEKDDTKLAHKSKLVPGIELTPFSTIFPSLQELSEELGGPSGSLGSDINRTIFRTKEFSVAPVVCYESAFGGYVAEQCRLGVDFICIITNDGWWKDTPGYKQHQSFASLRAIENRKSIARSANTGSSCFVNQRGDILQATGWWVPAVIKGTINKNANQSFYTKYGNMLGRVSGFVVILLILYTFVSWFKLKFVRK